MGWQDPIDLLVLDGDQSVAGAREAFEAWFPFLKPGGTIAVHNANFRTTRRRPRCVVKAGGKRGFNTACTDIRLIGKTMFGVRAERIHTLSVCSEAGVVRKPWECPWRM